MKIVLFLVLALSGYSFASDAVKWEEVGVTIGTRMVTVKVPSEMKTDVFKSAMRKEPRETVRKALEAAVFDDADENLKRFDAYTEYWDSRLVEISKERSISNSGSDEKDGL